jgi:tetratricopeptide (TPR) repeat protein
MSPKALLLIFGWLAATPLFGQVSASTCGSLDNAYGPFDYKTERAGKLQIVEQFHFTAEVEALIRGTSGTIGTDLDYTLRASPNHHRALLALSRYGERLKSPQPGGMRYSIDCYFDRAIRFRPDDTVVRALFAQHLGKVGRTGDALRQLEQAVRGAEDNAISHYNIGLVYFGLKDYDRALAQAHKAMSLGYARPELVNLLKGVNKWQDRTEAATQPAYPPSAASAAQ